MKPHEVPPSDLSDSGSFRRLVEPGLAAPPPGRRALQARLSRLWRPAGIFLLALGPVVGVLTWRIAGASRDERVQARFEDLVSHRAQAISEQAVSFFEVLHACEGLFDSSEHVTRGEFASFTRSARSRHPRILALAWAPWVPGAQRLAHEAQVREDGPEDYRIVPSAAGGGPPADCLPLDYLEPWDANRHRVGQDVMADPVLSQLARTALPLHRPLVSQPLEHEVAGQPPLAVAMLAVRKGGKALGVVLLRFRYVDLLLPTIGSELRDGQADMHLSLYDAEVGGRPVLVARAGPGSAPPSQRGFTATYPLDVGAQAWTLSALPSGRFLDRARGDAPLWYGVLAFVLWELLTGCLLSISHAFNTSTLRHQGRTIGRVMQSLAEGVVVAGPDGHVHLANDAARELIGVRADDLGTTAFGTQVAFRHAEDFVPFSPEEAPLARALRGEVMQPVDCVALTPAHPAGVWVSVSSRPLRDESGRLRGGVLVLRDIMKRRRSEIDLRERDARLREREIEMQLAAQVQRRLYPHDPPRVAGLDIAAVVEPAEETCGDYYDHLELPDGALLLAVGDVSGHGLGPALVMAEARAYVRSLALAGKPPDVILEHVGRALCGDLGDEQFVTMVLVRIEADGRTVHHASAGHTPVLCIAADGTLRAQLGQTGPPLGLFPGSRYTTCDDVVLEDGDMLVLMTDGATEAPGPAGTFFEEEGVIEVVRAHCHEPAEGILGWITAALHHFSGDALHRDDVTLVICKREHAGVPAQV